MTTGRKRIAIVGKAARDDVRRAIEEDQPWLAERAEVVFCDLTGRQSLRDLEADLLVIFGGDGSMLDAARRLDGRPIPVVGVNFGKLGFLAAFTREELRRRIDGLLAGDFRVSRRMLLAGSLDRGGASIGQWLALNDYVLQAGWPFRVIDVQLKIGGERVTLYRSDGVIISTPTGSTAHSLSAGGPVMAPDAEALLVTPICPHSLSIRPLVCRADATVELELIAVLPQTTLVVDGRETAAVQTGDIVRVAKAPGLFHLVETTRKTYFQTLHEKLSWGGHPNYGQGSSGCPA